MDRNHWSQTIAIVAPLVALGLITTASTTWVLSNEISGVRTDSIMAQATLTAKVAADEERIAALERTEASHYADDVAFRAEMRNSIASVITSLADVRVAIGHNHK